MKQKKQIKIIISLLVMIAVLIGGWGLLRGNGLKAKEKNAVNVSPTEYLTNITEPFKSPDESTYDASILSQRVVENEDGTKTFIADKDNGIKVTNIKRLNQDLTEASWQTSMSSFFIGIGFTISIDNTNNEIRAGDKIIIPILGSCSTFRLPSTNIPLIGDLEYLSPEIGYEITVNQQMIGKVERTIALGGGNESVSFPIEFSIETNGYIFLPVSVYYGETLLGTITTDKTIELFPSSNLTIATGPTLARGIGAGSFSNAFHYLNVNQLMTGLAGKEPTSIPYSIIEMSKVTINSEMALLSFSGENKESLPVWFELFLPTAEGDLMNLPIPPRLRKQEVYDFVELPQDASWEQVQTILSSAGVNKYGVVENSDGTYTVARNLCTGSQGVKLTDTDQFMESGASNPIEYINSLNLNSGYNVELAKKINDIYSTRSYASNVDFVFRFEDDTLPFEYQIDYQNSLDAKKVLSGKSNPNKVMGDGESLVKVRFLGEDGDPVKMVQNIVGNPTTPGSMDKAVITTEDLFVSGYVLDMAKLPDGADPNNGALMVDFPEEGKTTTITYYYQKLPTINLTKTDTEGGVLEGVTMSIGAKVTTLEGEKLMSLPALYNEMMGDYLAITADPLVTDAEGKITMPSTDPRIATMWDLQSQGSRGSVQKIDQWVFVETQAADKYQPSPFNTFDTNGGQSDIPDPDTYQGQFVFDITSALEIGGEKSYSPPAPVTNKLNQFKVQPTAIGPDGVDFSSITYEIGGKSVNSGVDSENLALSVTGGSETTYELKQTNTLPGYTVANDMQSFTIAQNPNKVDEFKVTIPAVTNDAFTFYYKVDASAELHPITSGTPFTSTYFLTNPILYIKVENKAGENALGEATNLDFGTFTLPNPKVKGEERFPVKSWSLKYTYNNPNEPLTIYVKLEKDFTNNDGDKLNDVLYFRKNGEDGEVDTPINGDSQPIETMNAGLSSDEKTLNFTAGGPTGFFLKGSKIIDNYQDGNIPVGTEINYEATLLFTLAEDSI